MCSLMLVLLMLPSYNAAHTGASLRASGGRRPRSAALGYESLLYSSPLLSFSLQSQDLGTMIEDIMIFEPIKRGQRVLSNSDRQIVVTELIVRKGLIRVVYSKEVISFRIFAQDARYS